jgi:hypothetical protein
MDLTIRERKQKMGSMVDFSRTMNGSLFKGTKFDKGWKLCEKKCRNNCSNLMKCWDRWLEAEKKFDASRAGKKAYK